MPPAVGDTRELLTAQPLVGALPDAVRELVIDSFVPAAYALGEDLVRQGEPTDGFYVLAGGRAQALRSENGIDVTLRWLGPGDTFGESDLLERAVCEATVRAAEPVTALRLEPALFGAIVRRHPEVGERVAVQSRARRAEPLLRSHPVFSSLPREALVELASELQETTIPAASTIFSEGDPAGPLYIVAAGRLRVSDAEHGNLRYLRAGDVFGELSIYLDSPRTATVEAVSTVRLLALRADVFRRYLSEYPEMVKRVGDQLAFYERGPARQVPLDFAEELSKLSAGGELPAPAERPSPAVSLGERRPRRQLWRRKAARHVPYVPQLDETDDAAACLAMLCRHFGHDVRTVHIRDVLGSSVGSASLQTIERAARTLGFEVTRLEEEDSQLEKIALPAVVHWPGEHWAVLDEVRTERVHIADPATGSGWTSREELDRYWDGLALSLKSTPALAEAPTEHADLGWLVALARPHRRLLALVLVLALVAAALQMLVPVVTGEIVDSVVKQKDYTRLYLLTGGLFVLQVAALFAALVQARITAGVAVQIDHESLAHLADRMLRLPLSYFETRRSGDIEHRLGALRVIREFAAQDGVQALAQGSQLVVSTVLMGLLSPVLMLAWLATLPVYLLLVRAGVRRVRPPYQSEEEGFARLRSRQLDAIQGVEAVKSLGMEEGVRKRLLHDFEEVAHRVARADLAAISYGGMVSFVTFLLLILFLFFGALEVMAGDLSIGQLVAFNSLVLVSSGPIIWLLGMWDRCQLMTVHLGRLGDILDREPEQAGSIPAPRPVPTLEGRVTLKDICFSYPADPDRRVLEGVSIDVLPGMTVAIVGRSGSGKSTLLKCIAGLLQATGGSIAFDGVDLRELSWSELRRRVGFVPQQPYLFDDTLARNIGFGDTAPDVAAVRAAARIAAVDSFAEKLPLGYGTRVGDGGIRLSGGQTQRVAIARSIYYDAAVLLLDEAMSGLDTEAEQAVSANMRRLLDGRTAFIVAHRLTTVRDSDLIVVLDEGHVAEMGTHEELFAADGLYFHLYAPQAAGV